MLHAILLVALAQVAQPAPSQWGAAAPAASPNGIADFSAHGKDLPPWAPTPALALDGASYKPGDTTWANTGSLGGALTKIGSPLAWYGSPFYPDGFEEAQRVTVWPSSISDYYEHGTGADVLDVMGGGCIVTWVDSLATTKGVAVNGNESNTGWRVQRNAGNFLFVLDGYAGTPVAQAAGVVGLNVVCFGFTATKAWILINGTASAEVTVSGSYTPGTGSTLRLGRSGGLSGDGHGVVEFLYTSTPMSLEVLRTMALATMRCAGTSCIPEDSGTVSHVTFDASGNAVDSKGLAWTKTGTLTALQVPIVWPGNRTPLNHPSVKFDGASYFSGGDIADPSGSFTVCVEFTAGAALGGIVTKDNGGAREWGITQDSTSVVFVVFKNNSTYTLKSIGSYPDAGAQYFSCASYEWVADGTSVIRGTTNGVAVAATTNAVGPVQNTAAPLLIGYDFGTRYFTGKVGHVWFWDNWAASDAEMDKIYRHYVGLTVEKPASDLVAFSRNDTHSACCPISDASCHKLGANMPCITSRGLERAGPTSNLISRSETFTIDGYPWTSATASAPTTTSGTWVAPNGSVGWTMEDTDATTNQGLSAFFSTSPGTFVCSAWLKSITTSAVFWRAYVAGGAGHGVTSDFTLTPVPRRYEWSFTAGTGATAVGIQIRIGTAVSGTSTGQIGLADFQCHEGTVARAYRSTTGTVYSGPETVVSVPDARRDLGRFAVLWTGTLDDWTPTTDYRVFWSYGSSDAANSVTAYLRTTTNMNFFVYDSVPAGRTWNLTPGALADGQHSILFDAKLGTFRASIDGVLQAGSGTPTGTGIPTASLPLNLCRAGTNTYSANCWIKRVVQATFERSAR